MLLSESPPGSSHSDTHKHRACGAVETRSDSFNAWDASGASALGFKLAWVNRFGRNVERLPGKPDVEIKGLAEWSDALK